eukprot:scaffold161088_cov53-Attheya_sp.AAC.2
MTLWWSSVVSGQAALTMANDDGDASPTSSLMRRRGRSLSSSSSTVERLLEHIRSRAWPSVVLHIKAFPEDASHCTSNRSTPLHLACLYKAPYDTMLALLEAAPSKAMAAQDEEGWTPLHVCLLYGYHTEETCLLLIRYATQAGAVATQSQYMGSPLHVGSRHGMSTVSFAALLEADPRTATCPNEGGATPATLLWHNFRKNSEVSDPILHQLHQHVDMANNHGNGLQPFTATGMFLDHTSKELIELLDKMELLLHAAAKLKKGGSVKGSASASWKMVHAAIEYSEVLGLPIEFVQLLILAFFHELREQDEWGRLPLHVALQNPGTWPFIPLLVQQWPEAASCLWNNTLPLHLALMQDVYRSVNSPMYSHVISCLVSAAPDALSTRHESSSSYSRHLNGLYPFMLAAVAKNSTTKAMNTDNMTKEVVSTDTIFMILQAAPHLVFYSSSS